MVLTVGIDEDLLETTQSSIGHIARVCDFRASAAMNRTLPRRLDTSLAEHRRHFGASVEDVVSSTSAG